MVFLANRSAALQRLYGQQHSFQILSTFLYDIYVSCQLANTVWQWAKASALLLNLGVNR